MTENLIHVPLHKATVDLLKIAINTILLMHANLTRLGNFMVHPRVVGTITCILPGITSQDLQVAPMIAVKVHIYVPVVARMLIQPILAEGHSHRLHQRESTA